MSDVRPRWPCAKLKQRKSRPAPYDGSPQPNLKLMNNSERGNHGAPVRLAVDEKDASASLVAQSTSAQRGFLNAVMNDNVRFGEFLGVELLLDQWERYSLYHAAIDQYEEGPLVVSITADLRVCYSRRTIEEVFPHLIGDEELIQSLIGLEVTYPSINHFHFGKDGKIEWYAPEADFVGALMNVLKNPMLVARVMGNALITKGHMIGDESDGRQLPAAEPVAAPIAFATNSVSDIPLEDALDAECQHIGSSTKYDVAIVSRSSSRHLVN
ncbi:hypothetical protein PHYSODRAFT_264541 [Phytophthora sojae]|uniref:Uncharacterized protein n=1 Tax=Phytophthora sojae (strain P6497) TaxID=1094619 RepID=G4Z2E6_PHYSP|nr:hypothetical protein PHYSODRAFT_264541 [Phytophthora sojae]EGZ19987.1 hypothetical protein PHYSODRAFT_264541 [Phytophthora sojae]|eukprot:XP_009522704.1 hypothetical protein PHYSODRAFT_264541 [Phytophthora sojae]